MLKSVNLKANKATLQNYKFFSFSLPILIPKNSPHTSRQRIPPNSLNLLQDPAEVIGQTDGGAAALMPALARRGFRSLTAFAAEWCALPYETKGEKMGGGEKLPSPETLRPPPIFSPCFPCAIYHSARREASSGISCEQGYVPL